MVLIDYRPLPGIFKLVFLQGKYTTFLDYKEKATRLLVFAYDTVRTEMGYLMAIPNKNLHMYYAFTAVRAL